MKKYFFCIALTLILTSCATQRDADPSIHEPPVELPRMVTPLPEPTPSPPSQPTSEIVKWPTPLRRLFPVTGVITDFYGPLTEDGTVTWDADWFEINIKKPDSTPAIIVGVHSTAFIFGSKLQIGMEVTAYVLYDYPVFVTDPPSELSMYIASAIIAGFPTEQGIIVCCDFAEDETFSFIVNNTTEYFNAVQKRVWRHWADAGWVDWLAAPRSNDGTTMLAQSLMYRNPFENMTNRLIAVLYDTTRGDLPVAKSVMAFHDWSPFNIWIWNNDIPSPPQKIVLNFTNYIFPADAFEIVDLPIFINGEEINSAPPIFAADGAILVPFREAMAASTHVAEGAWLTNDGNLNLYGGGGGSEDSHWQIGRASVGYMATTLQDICSPPIIVGGIIYVPLSAMKHNAPFASAWLFDDRIEIYGTSGYFYRACGNLATNY